MDGWNGDEGQAGASEGGDDGSTGGRIGEGGEQRVKVACGHCTHNADAAELLQTVEKVFHDGMSGKLEWKTEGFKGITLIRFEQPGGRVSFRGPKQLFDEFSERLLSCSLVFPDSLH